MSAISLAEIVALEAEHGAVWPDGLELPSKAIWWYGCREFWWMRGLAAVILRPQAARSKGGGLRTMRT
jgi:hypothetical protein